MPELSEKEKVVLLQAIENNSRKAFTASELVALKEAIDQLLKTDPSLRQRLGPKSKDGRYRTQELLGAVTGTSGRTIVKAAEMVRAARAEPKRYQRLVQEMDRTGKVNGLYTEFRRLKDEATLLSPATRPRGRYRTIVIDCPWEYRSVQPLAKSTLTTPYKTQSQDDLRKIPVASWADTNAHLYAWAPNTHIEEALALVKDWGFEFKTMLVWRKDRGNPGRYFFMSTELCLFAVRGRLSTRVKTLQNVIDAPRTRHSEKPTSFYDLVETASYGPYLDVFARRRRTGWTAWGNLDEKAQAG